MLFNSFPFLFGFLPLTLVGFFLLARWSRLLAASWLAAASLVFYGYWDIRYVGLLIASIAFNFLCGRRLSRSAGTTAARRLLVAGVAVDLAVLALFKYADFAVVNLNAISPLPLPTPRLVLPLGISFYTFTQVAFLVDAARGQAREYRPVHYLLFVTWFPHLIAGPVLHHRSLMPQFEREKVYRWSAAAVASGLMLFTIGLAKKVLLADALAPAVGPAFTAAASGAAIGAAAAWTAVLAYTFQLYFDFSGYSDMAIGLSQLFGVTLPLNFASPYKAVNITDFWRRWHMTLSAFLRDYLYIPLGGNRKGRGRRYVNLLVTMVLGGLWHGANWTFVAWGAFHGALIAAHHAWRDLRPAATAATTWPRAAAGTALTFLCVMLAWVLFRADSLGAAARMFAAMAGLGPQSPWPAAAPLSLLAASAVIVFALPNSNEWLQLAQRHEPDHGWQGVVARRALGPLGGTALGILFVICLSRLTAFSSEFLYFQF